MNWDAVGAIAELAGALAVVATLFYLASQVRQGREATEANTKSVEQSRLFAEAEFHSNSIRFSEPFYEWIAKDETLATLYRKGLIELSSLSDIEIIRFNALMSTWVLSVKAAMESYNRGLLDEATLLAWEAGLASHLNMSGGSEWWDTAQNGFIPQVRDRLEIARTTAPSINEVFSGFPDASS